MISISIDAIELYDSEKNEFVNLPAKTVKFEYSLIAVSKWEAKWKIPFLTYEPNTIDEKLIDFYQLMAFEQNLPSEYITAEVANKLSEYLKDTQTATTFNVQNESKNRGAGKVYTSEELYALMFMNGIPIDFEKRNLNRLLVILKIISIYNKPPEKMSRQDVLRQNAELNAQRKKQHNTRG